MFNLIPRTHDEEIQKVAAHAPPTIMPTWYTKCGYHLFINQFVVSQFRFL